MKTIEKESSPPIFSNELNIESIISAPLIAVSKANVMMLSGQLGFLLDYCFEKSGSLYSPIMINMEINNGNIGEIESENKRKLYFQIPLLCLLPINSIAVDNIKVDFDLEVTSIGSYKSNNQLFEKRAVINGKIAPAERKRPKQDSDNTQNSTRLKVQINVGQLPLPKGVLSILDLYTRNIVPILEDNINQSEKE